MFVIASIFLACLSFFDSSTGNRCSLNATFYFVEDETPNVTCSGFVVGYWSLTGPSTGGQEIRIGDCSSCAPDSACSCKTDTTDYSIPQNGTTNVLLFVNNLPANNRSTIRCSADNNSTCAAISINIIKAPARCQHADNCIDIVEDQPTPITCKGAPDKDIYWSVTRASTPETRIGNCSKCNSTTQLPCDCQTDNGDFNITRTGHARRAVSILQFLSNVETYDNSTIKCSTSDDTVIVSVSINVIPARDVHVNQGPDTGFPVAAVAGSAVGCVFIVAAVIVIAVIVKRRRQKARNREEATSSTNGAADNYDGLHKPDVGQRSVYSEIGPRPTSSSAGPDYTDLYHGLDMSEVGQRSEYSQFGQNI